MSGITLLSSIMASARQFVATSSVSRHSMVWDSAVAIAESSLPYRLDLRSMECILLSSGIHRLHLRLHSSGKSAIWNPVSRCWSGIPGGLNLETSSAAGTVRRVWWGTLCDRRICLLANEASVQT